jgi:hypothetical protein
LLGFAPEVRMTIPGAKSVALAAVLTLSLISTVARAQEAPVAPGPYVDESPEPERRSTGRMVTGIVLTATAAANLAGGGALAFASATTCNSEYCGFGILGGGAAMALGGVLAAIGIPLWVSGARPASPGEDARTTAVPTLAVGPKRVTLGWSF